VLARLSETAREMTVVDDEHRRVFVVGQDDTPSTMRHAELGGVITSINRFRSTTT